jgi:general secretion pathway protein K
VKGKGLLGLSQRGIALPLVLWTITVLMAIVFSFAVAARTEMRMTVNFRDSIEKRLLAEAGIERALMEISYRNSFAGKGPEETDLQVWRIDGVPYSDSVGKGSYKVSIMDESGRISINGLTDASGILLKNLLTRLDVKPEVADTIVDSILDWKDSDDLHRLNGAESDYYSSLPNPYKAKNSDFETPEELLLVKGMTEEILFGSGKNKGLLPFITVFSKHAGVNPATAAREVLLSIPGMTDGIVESILASRDASPSMSSADVQTLLGPVGDVIRPYIGATGQNTFTLNSGGYKQGEKGNYAITATVRIQQDGYRYVYYKSPAWVEQ